MSDYLKLAAAALAAHNNYKNLQYSTSSDGMTDHYRKYAGDMLAEAQALAILAMAEAVVKAPETVTAENAQTAFDHHAFAQQQDELGRMVAKARALGLELGQEKNKNAALAARVAFLESCPESPAAAKPEDTDKQARELIAEIHRLEMDVYRAEGDLSESEAENTELARQRDTLEFALGTAADKIRRLTEDFCALEAQRNSLAAQVDDLRNINAGLRIALSDPAPCTGTGSCRCDCLPDEED